jgi:hypothetical protein
VLAASAGSLDTNESRAASAAKTEPVLFHNKATDNWNFFEAKCLKKNIYDIAAAESGTKSGEFRAQASRNDADGVEIQRIAEPFESLSDEALKRAQIHEDPHHFLTIAVIMLHISIAIATIAIIGGGH